MILYAIVSTSFATCDIVFVSSLPVLYSATIRLSLYLIDIPQCSKGTVRPDLGCEQGCY